MSIFGLIQLPGGAGALGIDHPNGGTIYNPGHCENNSRSDNMATGNL
jgi:hypothetical protein